MTDIIIILDFASEEGGIAYIEWIAYLKKTFMCVRNKERFQRFCVKYPSGMLFGLK